MSRWKVLLVFALVLAGVIVAWSRLRGTSAPSVAFAKVERQNLVSTLPTNGKVEPSDWVAVRAERAGIVETVDVQKGQTVQKGALLLALDSRDSRASVASSEAAVAQAKAQLETIEHGGTASAQVEIQNQLERDRMDLTVAQSDYESLKRLVEKQAATRQDLAEASQRVQKLQADIQALQRKHGALVSSADRSAAESRLSEAEAALEQARARLERSRIQAPMAGVVYELPVRSGAYLNIGDLAANIGNLRTLRVRIYVDEPELGRVAVGMPVQVTWDALPGRIWKGTVEKLPTQIVPLGTRQVGEVICTIDNEDLRLLPGTNVNVEITSQAVAGGLVIPKEAIRTENGKVGVYVLRDGHLEWRPVQLGASSITHAAVSSGLSAGELVALRTDEPLKNGEEVRTAAR
jgi:HlyD family secretion protein